jgi:hypothetical protein
MRILVTGTRYADRGNAEHVRAVSRAFINYADFYSPFDDVTIVHGGARGVDTIAGICAHAGWKVETCPADWNKHGKAAGFIRNQEMVDTKPDICLAFPASNKPSNGTWDTITRCAKYGIKVQIYPLSV